MSAINITLPEGEFPVTGKQITFEAPCNSNEVTDIVVNGITYDFVDSIGNPITPNAFVTGSMVSIILNNNTLKAFIQNPNITSYIESKLGEVDAPPVVLADMTTTEQTSALVIPLGDDVRNYSRLLITLTMKHYQAASSPGIYLWDTVEGSQHGRLTDFKDLFNETNETTVYFDVTFFANSIAVQASKKVSSISASDGVVSLVSNFWTDFHNAELIDAIRISSMYMDTGAKIKVEGVPK